MDRDRSGQTWARIRDRIAFRWDKPTNDDGGRLELIGARAPSDCEGRTTRAWRETFNPILAARLFGGDMRRSEIVVPASRQRS
jgi:hypothetical protein